MVVILLGGCVTSYEGTYVPRAIFAAWTWEQYTRRPARITISHVRPGIDHAQAQGWDGEEWKYLCNDGWFVFAGKFTGKEPYKTLTIRQALDEHVHIHKLGSHYRFRGRMY